jgi:hypothetical protein
LGDYSPVKYQEQHEAFKRLMIQQGIYRLEQLNQALPFGCSVPAPKIDKWLNRLLELPTEFCGQRRYVNRFKLGADPEFVFSHGGERTDARLLQLQQGLAFGMDNNGRLTEIRPYPSRSALNVTASILAALRWMAILYPKTLAYDWCAGAWICGDGVGGHVHFGRKRPGRDVEVKALDVLEDELLAVNAYPCKEVMRRRQGDGRNHPYGLPGDIRLQLHGYEYRTFPSWLDSPELAFLTITLAKLVVQNPALTQGYVVLPSVDRHFQRIKNLLAYYKDVDDDARLALKMITKKFPIHAGGDFKKRWGIGDGMASTTKITCIPQSVKPDREDIEEMFEYLAGNRILWSRVPKPTWNPLNPPNGYVMAIHDVNTHGAKGLGELVWDVCRHESFDYVLGNNRDMQRGLYFVIPRNLAKTLPVGWQKFCGGKVTVGGDGRIIYSSEKTREAATFHECRRLLLETVFPFWQVGKVKPDSYDQWKAGLAKRSPKPKFQGQILYGDILAMPVQGMRD